MIQNTRIQNRVYSKLNRDGYDTPVIIKSKRAQKIIGIMIKNQKIDRDRIETIEKILDRKLGNMRKEND